MKYPRKQDEFTFQFLKEDGTTIFVSRDKEGNWSEIGSYAVKSKKHLHDLLLRELMDSAKVVKLLQEDINIDEKEQKHEQ